MTDNPDRSPVQPRMVVKNDASSGIGMAVAAVILVIGIIAAIWYFQSNEGSNPGSGDVTITIDPNADPGTATSILP
jgi:hypothetical protein